MLLMQVLKCPDDTIPAKKALYVNVWSIAQVIISYCFDFLLSIRWQQCHDNACNTNILLLITSKQV